MKKATALSILIAIVVLAFGLIAEAQQAEKVPRIGYLSGSPPSSIAERIEAFAKVCASLDIWRVKIL
jgi:hypothetical protein